MKRENAWEKYDETKQKEVFSFSEGYKNFISDCKTERECVTEVIKQANDKGFRDLYEVIKNKEALKPGDKVYANNMGKAIALFVIGKNDIENGLNIIGSHVDSPRLDIKQNPLYEEDELALLETHYYGGIKKYQWVTIPLALHGVVVRKDGTVIHVSIGEKEDEPVVGISDLLVHLSGEQLEKKANKVIEGEDLNVLVGSIPLSKEEKDKVKGNILRILQEKYGFEEDDFVSAEIEVVPAGRARDYGLDRSMIMGYGHDDRICAYTSLMALFDMETPDKTSVCLLVDKEEIGSVGATGMHSKFFENTLAEILDLVGQYSELKIRRALRNSKMLSADVSAAFDPNFASTMEKKNAAFFGHGLVFNKYTGARGKSGSNDANPEFIAEIRRIMDNNEVSFQTAELGKVDQGGGGTIAYILAEYDMEVIDCGIALHNMHAPWEVASKVDIYEAKRGYQAFYMEA